MTPRINSEQLVINAQHDAVHSKATMLLPSADRFTAGWYWVPVTNKDELQS